MIKNGIGKDKISIDKIGRRRFWIGLSAGLITAITLSFAFNNTREAFRIITTFNSDLLILPQDEFQFYNYFYSAVATTLGLSMTIWIWMSNIRHKRRKDRLFKRLTQTNALLSFWVILMVITRFGTILPLILYGLGGYEDQLNFKNDYWLLLVLIPAVVFCQNWFTVRLVYKSTKWILYSLAICTLTAFTLSHTTTVDQDKINNAYYAKYETEYTYIDTELQAAKTKYGIDFDNETREILRKWNTPAAMEQVYALKRAFARDNKVTMDTIILEKIVQHNLKLADWSWRQKWRYTLPRDIYYQIKKFTPQDPETKELFLLLKTQIDLFNNPGLDWDRIDEYTNYEYRKSSFVENQLRYSDGLVIQLTMVRDSLISDSSYIDFHSMLPTVDPKIESRY